MATHRGSIFLIRSVTCKDSTQQGAPAGRKGEWGSEDGDSASARRLYGRLQKSGQQ